MLLLRLLVLMVVRLKRRRLCVTLRLLLMVATLLQRALAMVLLALMATTAQPTRPPAIRSKPMLLSKLRQKSFPLLRLLLRNQLLCVTVPML